MNDDDDEAMPPPKPKVTTGSPTPSEKAAEKPPPLARIITTASEPPSPPKNFKKQKVEETEITTDPDFLLEDEEDDYIPDEYATTLTNFAYPELNSQRDFEELLDSGISNDSDLMAKIGKNMKKEQEYYDDYHRNKEMYTNWFWLHENHDSDLVDYDDAMVKKIRESYKIKYERLKQATAWIVGLSKTIKYNKYPINHYMHLLLKEMDSFVYSVPMNELKVNVYTLKGELLRKFEHHCNTLEAENLGYDTYDPTLLFTKQDQLHLQKLYYYI